MQSGMSNIILRKAISLDFDAIITLNTAEIQYTSPMDQTRLHHLDSLACYHKVAVVDGVVAAFLLAMQDGCGYVNDNFDWFGAHLQSFLYIDRIVVSAFYQRQKLGSRLYRDIFAYARTNNIPTIACEYNIKPPNKISGHFHDKFGFQEIGRQWLDNGTKQVSLQIAKL